MKVDEKKKEKEEHQTAQQQPDFYSQGPCDRSPTFTKPLPFSLHLGVFVWKIGQQNLVLSKVPTPKIVCNIHWQS